MRREWIVVIDTKTHFDFRHQVCFLSPSWKVCPFNEQSSYLMQMPTPKFSSLPRWRSYASNLLNLFCFALPFSKKTQRICLLPPCSPSLALCPLGSPGTIMPFFQAIAKPNLPHKLIGLHLKSEGDGVKEKTRQSDTERRPKTKQ